MSRNVAADSTPNEAILSVGRQERRGFFKSDFTVFVALFFYIIYSETMATGRTERDTSSNRPQRKKTHTGSFIIYVVKS